MIRFADVEKPRPAPAVRPKAAKIAAARKAVAETKTPRETKTPKGGRPRKQGAEPWDEAGVSRAAWYRQQKAKAKP